MESTYIVEWSRDKFSDSWYLPWMSFWYKKNFKTLDEFVEFKNEQSKHLGLSRVIRLV
jgi:hypothetical protein